MGEAIRIENLNKSYGKVKAVSDLSFSVEEGELFAFLGVNGAGKSTSISIICGQLGRDSGRVYIGGKDIDKDPENMKRSLGVVFQNSALDRTLTVRDNLQSRAALYGICGEVFEKRVLEVSGLLEIGDILKRPVGKLSGGQRRKADIARALIHSPKILILDEPTTGLDPQSRKTLWNVISSLRKERSLTVLLTTHYMEEAAGADNVVIIDGGKIVAEGSPLALKNRYCGDFVTLYGVDELSVKALGVPYEPVLGGYRLSVLDTAAATALILANPGLFRDYEVVKGNMDHVFLAATGKILGEPEQNLRRRGRR